MHHGSAFKMVPALAALNEKKITTDETVFCSGIYPRGHHPRCWTYRYTGGGHRIYEYFISFSKFM